MSNLQTSPSLTRTQFDSLLLDYTRAMRAAVDSGDAKDILKASDAYTALIKAVFP